MKKLIFLTLLLPSLGFSQNQQNCANTEEVIRVMQSKYEESVVVMGFNPTNKDVMLTIWVNQKTGTATVLKSSISRNFSCVVDILEDTKVVDTSKDKTPSGKGV